MGTSNAEIIKILEKYTEGKNNTEKVEISVLQLNRYIKALKDNLDKDEKGIGMSGYINNACHEMSEEYKKGNYDLYSYADGVYDALTTIETHMASFGYDNAKTEDFAGKAKKVCDEVNMAYQNGEYDEYDYYDGYNRGLYVGAEILGIKDYINIDYTVLPAQVVYGSMENYNQQKKEFFDKAYYLLSENLEGLDAEACPDLYNDSMAAIELTQKDVNEVSKDDIRDIVTAVIMLTENAEEEFLESLDVKVRDVTRMGMELVGDLEPKAENMEDMEEDFDIDK